ncbi:MAG: biotin-dependent carboxyltransferase family protein, partial [Bryobacteraceae bacterium]
PGLFTTVQDLGREGYTELGVSPAGACDTLALRIGNLLVGNKEGDAAIEVTIAGASFRFTSDMLVVLTGADFNANLDGTPVAAWCAFNVSGGQVLRLAGARTGARAYLCVFGGIAVPQVLGSASTHVLSGLGGLEGRALRKGDRLQVGPRTSPVNARRLPSRFAPLLRRESRIRVTTGAHTRRFNSEAVFRFLASPYCVAEDSNRMGLRLTGPPIPYTGEILSEGVALGSLQVPPNGEPVLLFVDSQTTGGYPVIACVISADLASAGQLRPRDEVRFDPVTIEEARILLREQETMMRELRETLA